MTATAVPAPQAAASQQAATMPGRLLAHAAQRPRAVAYRVKLLGRWNEVRWSEYAEQAERVGRGLAALGVGNGDHVAIVADNRPEWFVTDLAAQGLGAVSVGLSVTAPADDIAALLTRAKARVAIVDDGEQLDKLLGVRDKTQLERIVVIDTRGIGTLDAPGMSYEALDASGSTDAVNARSGPLDEWRQRVAALRSDQPATILFTPGTTGTPKGVILTHADLTAAAAAGVAAIGLGPDDELVSVLPLGEIAERSLTELQALEAGCTVHFGEGGASFGNDLREVKPTVFLGVPRLWENLRTEVEAGIRNAGRIKRTVMRAALRNDGGAGLALRRRRGPLALLLDLMVSRPLRADLGLGRVRVALSGAAPAPPELVRWWWSAGVALREVYGLAEVGGPATVVAADDVRPGTVGRAVPGLTVSIGGDGQVVLRGEAVFEGYVDDAGSGATVTGGELHTGDLGTLGDDGVLTIVGRTDEMILTSGGRRIAPASIEQRLEATDYVKRAVLVGEGRPCAGALLVLDSGRTGDWAAAHDVPYTTFRSLTERPEVRDLIQQSIDVVNATLDDQDRVGCFALLPADLTQDEGALTATFKLRRAATQAQLKPVIDAMYARPSGATA